MQRGMTRVLLFALGLVLGYGIAFYAGQDEGVARFRGTPAGGPDSPVLVVLVEEHADVDAVEEAVGRWSILAREPDSIALVEGRVVATTHAAAEKALTLAGWSDRPLEIIGSLSRDRPERREGSGRPAEAGGVDLEALQRKPTLTSGEAIALLRAIDTGELPF
jgi:hypothetical protein